jgi:hypothetical protein
MASVYDRSKSAGQHVWWVKYRTADGVVHRDATGIRDTRPCGRIAGQCPCRREAEGVANEIQRQIDSGTWGGFAAGPQSVEAYATRWIVTRRDRNIRTVDDDEARLKTWILPVIGKMQMADVTRADVKKVVARAEATISTTTKKPLAPRSVLAIHNIGRVLFNHALDDQIVSHNPFNLRARRRELPKKRDADPT